MERIQRPAGSRGIDRLRRSGGQLSRELDQRRPCHAVGGRLENGVRARRSRLDERRRQRHDARQSRNPAAAGRSLCRDAADRASPRDVGNADRVCQRNSSWTPTGVLGPRQPWQHRTDDRRRRIRHAARFCGHLWDRGSDGDLVAGSRQIRVTIWNENVHERLDKSVMRIYPDGMHEAIAAGLRREPGAMASFRFATLEEPEHGLTEEVLSETDVLTWWGHKAHDQVTDEVVSRVHARVLEGMGIVALHSAHYSKIFRRL